jgi:FHS family L-fucose permease-like MFS transporter
LTHRHPFIVLLIFLTFFVISFITNILGPLVPDIIDGFDLSLALAGFLPFSFFIAYGVMSIPAGILLERYREKKVIIGAFLLAFAGSLWFASTPTYAVALASLFLIGVGMTMLQVAINPLLRAAGGEEHFAFNSVIGQLVFGGASFLSPYVYSYLVTNLDGDGSSNLLLDTLAPLVPDHLPWASLYWVFALVTLLMVVIMLAVRLPDFSLSDDEKAGAWDTHRELLEKPAVIAYFFGIFCYVGSEQGIANWISQFLATYHGFDPQVEGARAVAWFWGLLTAGCLLGLVLLKLLDCRKVLVGFSLAAMVSLTFALFGSASVAYTSFMLVGFFLSVMWSVIFSLALNSVARHHGSFSGILCTGIVGGAIVSLLVGWLGDRFGLRAGMMLVYLTLGYILVIGLRAKPLVDNATMSVGELFRSLLPGRS